MLVLIRCPFPSFHRLTLLRYLSIGIPSRCACKHGQYGHVYRYDQSTSAGRYKYRVRVQEPGAISNWSESIAVDVTATDLTPVTGTPATATATSTLATSTEYPTRIPTDTPTPPLTVTKTPVRPEAPTNLNATVSSTGVTLTWNVPAGDVSEFLLYRYVIRSSSSSLSARRTSFNLPAGAGSTFTFIDTSVTSAGTYRYEVRVQKPTVSDWSDRLDVDVTDADLASTPAAGQIPTETSTPEPMTCIKYRDRAYILFPVSNFVIGTVDSYPDSNCNRSMVARTFSYGLVYSTGDMSDAANICSAQNSDHNTLSARNPSSSTNSNLWECYIPRSHAIYYANANCDRDASVSDARTCGRRGQRRF